MIKGVKVARSSTELDTKEWEEKMTLTRLYGAEIGIDIPEPNEGIYASN